AVNGVSRNSISRLNDDGSLDPTFNPGAGPNKGVSGIALQSDGRILIGGTFATFNGISRARVARLNADGSLDSTFDPGAGPNTSVVALSLQPDGKILIGGDFTAIGGVTRNYIARLNADGSLDTSFQPNIALTYGGVLALKTEVDGKCLVGGDYTMVDGVSRKNLVRLNVDGSLDAAFNTGTGPGSNVTGQEPRVRGLAIQADGKVLVGGGFNTFNGVRQNYLARLLADDGGALEFENASFSVDENGGSALIAVRRTGSTNGTVTVNYLTRDGTAAAGSDYVAQAGALSFG